jgi:hypothetical protein
MPKQTWRGNRVDVRQILMTPNPVDARILVCNLK